ncbi:DUF2637 domain-containing protein [Streptomyces sp. NPDC013953]|uniref:DUF2637 domain-containing protein n=1 Tax=Streptomyces sp. NPDC013953 TaxID=3364868 RepID=UPI003701347C
MREYYAGDSFNPHMPVPDVDQPWVPLHDPLEPNPSVDEQVPAWDPAEELAFLLQEATEEDRGRPSAELPSDGTDCPLEREGMTRLVGMAAAIPPAPPTSHGRRRDRPPVLTWARISSFVFAALSVGLVTAVSVFSGIIAYDPLRQVARTHSPASSVSWWPLLVYGPWAVASLSILRAALHRRRALHSWAVVLLFSLAGMLLCVAEAPRTCTDMAAAALPTVAALACFQQMVRFITLTRPLRKTRPRHRVHEQPRNRPSP